MTPKMFEPLKFDCILWNLSDPSLKIADPISSQIMDDSSYTNCNMTEKNLNDVLVL